MVEIKTVPVRHVMLYTIYSNDWIDAAKRWYQRTNQKKQNFYTLLREIILRYMATKKIKIWQNCWTNNLNFDSNSNLVAVAIILLHILSPTTILSISMLVSCSRLPESSHFGRWNIKIVYTIAITLIVKGRNFKSCEQNT